MSPTKDGSALAGKTIWANGAAAANESALACQYISPPLAAGNAFQYLTHSFKLQALCQESGTNDNINRQPVCLKVYDKDGSTLRATLINLSHLGPNTTEWLNTGPRNKTFLDGDLCETTYTTAAGDLLVLELGGQVSSAGGTTVTGTISLGAPTSGADLGENETDTTTTLLPWFESSLNITFTYSVNPIETIGASDAYARVSNALRLIADSLGLAEVVDLDLIAGGGQAFNRSYSDTLGLLDVYSRLADANRLITDTMALATPGFTLREVRERELTEHYVGLSDAVLRLSDANRQQSDALGFSDAYARQVDYQRAVSDLLGLAEAVTLELIEAGGTAYDRTFTELLGMLDVFARLSDANRQQSDVLGMTDTFARLAEARSLPR